MSADENLQNSASEADELRLAADENADDGLQLADSENDDALRLADEEPTAFDASFDVADVSDEIAASTSLADGTILQADSQFGMRLERESGGEIYGVQTAAESESAVAQAAAISAQNGPTLTLNSDVNEVYGIAEPEPRPTPQSVAPTNNAKKSSSKTDFNTRNQTTSLEEIYERKRRERLERGDELFSGAKRAELPERPFWDRVFQPFKSVAFVFRIALISGAAFLPLFLATLFFARALSGDLEEIVEKNGDASLLREFFRCIWGDKIVFLLFTFIWAVFSFPHSFHIFVETANGADEIDEWPEYNFVGGLGQFLWLTTLIALAGIPGSALFSALGLAPGVGFTLAATAITPFFFLSCMQTDAPFTLATRETLVSLKRVGKSWLIFEGIAFAFLFGTIGLALFALGFAVKSEGSVGSAAFSAAIVSLAFSFIPALYLRFLGRLAWIIDDEARKRAAEEDDAEEFDDADEFDE